MSSKIVHTIENPSRRGLIPKQAKLILERQGVRSKDSKWVRDSRNATSLARRVRRVR